MPLSGVNPFRILNRPEPAAEQAAGAQDEALPPRQRLERMVGSAEVFVLMKGTPERPRCGYSANTVAALATLGRPLASFDVLSDEAIRAEAKSYAQWPTFPQVYLRGEFVGGHDIVTAMVASGQLEELLEGGQE